MLICRRCEGSKGGVKTKKLHGAKAAQWGRIGGKLGGRPKKPKPKARQQESPKRISLFHKLKLETKIRGDCAAVLTSHILPPVLSDGRIQIFIAHTRFSIPYQE